MEPRNEREQRDVELQNEEKRPRFRIEKLEERIAPSHPASCFPLQEHGGRPLCIDKGGPPGSGGGF